MSGLPDAVRDVLAELAPMLRRVVRLDPGSLARIRLEDRRAAALVQLPFGVLAARTVSVPTDLAADDLTVRAAELLGYIDGECDELPPRRDLEWRHAVPPTSGWQRVETVPDDVVRSLVRSGALTLRQAAEREGLPAAEPRAQVTNALLDTVVLDASSVGANNTAVGLSAQVTLRPLSALVRMGFVPRDSHVSIDLAGRWLRLAAMYGSVYTAIPGRSLRVMPR